MESFQYILPVGEFRSQGEKFFAEWLDSWSIPGVYEPECLRLPSGELYRPDFVLPISQVMVEIKPMIFADEFFKARQAAEILPSGWHFWIIEMRGRQPWAIDVCQIGDNHWRHRESFSGQNSAHRRPSKAGLKFNSINAKKYDDNDGASANRRCSPNCWARSRSQTDAVWRSSLGRCERTFQPGSHRLHEAAKPPNDRPTCVRWLPQSRNERHSARSRN